MGFIYFCIRSLITQTPQDRNKVWIDIFVCSSFPCLLNYFDALRLLSFESSEIASFSFEIWFRFFHPWCPFVWVIICFISWMEKNPFEQSNHFTNLCLQYILLIYIFFLEHLTLYINLFGFHLWHGIILNTIHRSILLLFCGSFAASFLGKTLMWSGWSPKIVF